MRSPRLHPLAVFALGTVAGVSLARSAARQPVAAPPPLATDTQESPPALAQVPEPAVAAPRGARTRVWLLFAALCCGALLFSGAAAGRQPDNPVARARAEAGEAEAARLELLGRLQLAGVAQRRVGAAGRASTRARTLASLRVAPAQVQSALARYLAALGPESLGAAVQASESSLASRVLADGRVHIYAGGRADIAAGRVDPRVLALLEYLADAHGEVGVSCLVSGHSRFVAQTPDEKKRKAPRRVSLHVSGRAVDISSIAGIPVVGNQQPGGVVEQTIREILALPASVRPSEVISLLDLSGPSFRLPDHADHLHVGY